MEARRGRHRGFSLSLFSLSRESESWSSFVIAVAVEEQIGTDYGCFSQKYLTLGNFSIFNSLDIQVCLEFLTWRWSMRSKRKRSWLTCQRDDFSSFSSFFFK